MKLFEDDNTLFQIAAMGVVSRRVGQGTDGHRGGNLLRAATASVPGATMMMIIIMMMVIVIACANVHCL